MNQVSTVAPLDVKNMPAEAKSKFENLQVQVQTLDMCRQLGHHYAQTDMVPKQYRGKPEDAAVAIQWGMEIGLQPLQALQNVAVVNGNATLWGDALVALVKQSGQCEYLTTQWDEPAMTAIVSTKRKGEPTEETRTYSMADAEKAGLAGRQTYQQHGKRMIQARARSHVLRDVYADLLKGFQVREVVEEDRDAFGEDYKTPAKEMGTIEVIQPRSYSQEDFEKNLPAWEGMLKSGKCSVADIVTKVASKGGFSAEQKEQLIGIEVEKTA